MTEGIEETEGTETVKLTKVVSSNVDSVGYDEVTGTLGVKFKGTVTYFYLEVSAAKNADLLAAPSVGKFVNEQIKPFHKWFKLEAEVAPVATTSDGPSERVVTNPITSPADRA